MSQASIAPPHAGTEQSKTNADEIEPFIEAVFAEAALMEPTLTFKQAGRYLMTYGYCVVQGPLLSMRDKPVKPKKQGDEDKEDFNARMVLYENQKRTWMPFRIRAPHPSQVLLDPLEKQPSIAIVHAYKYAIEIENLARDRQIKAGKNAGAPKPGKDVHMHLAGDNPYERILTDEIFTAKWHGLFKADGSMIFVEKNRPGFVPFGHCFSGFGQQPSGQGGGDGGKGTGGMQVLDPVHMAVGILDPILEDLRIHAQAHSGLHNMMIDEAFKRRYTSGDPQEIVNQESKGDAVVQVPGGKAALWLEETQTFTEAYFRAMNIIDQDIELGSFSKQLAGMREQGVITVGQQAILSTAAARKFVAPGTQIEHLATIVGVNILRLMDVLNETLTVRGHTLRPAQLEHDYSLQIKFEVLDPVMQMQERATAMNEHAARLISDVTYRERTRHQDESGERRRLDEEDARNLPEVARLRQRKILEEQGILEEIEAMEAEEAALLAAEGKTPSGGGEIPQGLTPNTPGQPRRGQALGDVTNPINAPI